MAKKQRYQPSVCYEVNLQNVHKLKRKPNSLQETEIICDTVLTFKSQTSETIEIIIAINRLKHNYKVLWLYSKVAI